jgi:hypothetical protein
VPGADSETGAGIAWVGPRKAWQVKAEDTETVRLEELKLASETLRRNRWDPARMHLARKT